MHLVDTTMFFCPKGGGVKQYLLAKREWLTKLAPAVRHTLLVPGPMPATCSGIRTCDTPSLPLGEGYRFPLSKRGWRNALMALEPDLIEAGDPYIAGLAARDAGQRLGIPVVAFFHSDVPRMLAGRCGAWIAPVSRMYLRHLYAGFDLVLAPSRTMLEKLHAWGIHNTALQPLGVDVHVFTPERREAGLRAKLGLAENTRLLVYAGRFAREKNLRVLAAAVARLGDAYHLLLVGGDRFVRISRHLTVWPYEAEPVRLARILASCDALVHAGDQETFGLIAIEALACGLPVVAVGLGGMSELIDDSVGVLVSRPEVDDLAEGIRALYSANLEQMRRAARARALRSHSWGAALQTLALNYSKVATPASGSWELRAHLGG